MTQYMICRYSKLYRKETNSEHTVQELFIIKALDSLQSLQDDQREATQPEKSPRECCRTYGGKISHVAASTDRSWPYPK